MLDPETFRQVELVAARALNLHWRRRLRCGFRVAIDTARHRDDKPEHQGEPPILQDGKSPEALSACPYTQGIQQEIPQRSGLLIVQG